MLCLESLRGGHCWEMLWGFFAAVDVLGSEFPHPVSDPCKITRKSRGSPGAAWKRSGALRCLPEPSNAFQSQLTHCQALISPRFTEDLR